MEKYLHLIFERRIKVIDLEVLEKEINNNVLHNSYLFCGLDELLIKENIELIIDKVVQPTFRELNLLKFDGNNINFEDFMNACETLPFMSEKKVVVIYRANFLKEKVDGANAKVFSQMEEYIKSPPEHCVLITYMLLNDKRDTVQKNKKVMKFDKCATIVKADKLRGDKLYKKVLDIFNKYEKNIGKIELRYFCDSVENNFNIIEREVEKLVSFTDGRDITRKDIDILLPHKSENDVFDLVEHISLKRPDMAIGLMNQLLYKGENLMLILSLIEGQFKKLLTIKISMAKGKNKEDIARDLRLPPFVCEKLMLQSKKFSIEQLRKCMKLCIEAEKTLKSSTLDKKTEMELMIINTVR